MADSTSATWQSDELVLARMWERQYDPTTIQIINDLPIAPNWRCLDVAAGAGSMAYWLADQVADGSVLAVDMDTTHLDADRAANLTVRQADATTVDLAPGSFDLVLARGAFSSLSDPAELFRRAVTWLAPGGWLVAEDFYFLPGDDAPTSVGRAVVGAYTRAFEMRGANVYWARRLPALMAQAGLTSVDTLVRALGPGVSAEESELIGTRLKLQGHTLVDLGLVTAEQITEFVDQLADPVGWDVTTLQFSVWGRKTS
jgi:hypothetical protein